MTRGSREGEGSIDRREFNHRRHCLLHALACDLKGFLGGQIMTILLATRYWYECTLSLDLKVCSDNYHLGP